MTNLKIYFDIDPAAPRAEVLATVEEGLHACDKVEHVDTNTDVTRFTGLEILAAVSLVANIVHHSGEIAHDAREIVSDTGSLVNTLRDFFHYVTDLAKKTPGVRQARVDIGMKSVPVAELSDADIARIADAVSARMKAASQPT